MRFFFLVLFFDYSISLSSQSASRLHIYFDRAISLLSSNHSREEILGERQEIATMTFLFTQEQVDSFNTEGCLCVGNFLSKEEVADIMASTHDLIDKFDISTHPLTKFTTGSKVGESHVGDAYFINSSDKVSFFLEPGAFDEKNQLTKPKDKAVNKIGHGLHLDKRFGKYTVNSRTADIASKLGFKDPRVLQSMIICKQPTIGGEVPSHQDGVFLYTTPQSAIGFWIALEDCTTHNGCLSYLPGSHKTTPIVKRFVRKTLADGSVTTEFIHLGGQEETYENTEEGYKTVECSKGSLVLIHNAVLHRSNLNLSTDSRYAYAFHVIDGEADYDERNWLQLPCTGGTEFTKLIV